MIEKNLIKIVTSVQYIAILFCRKNIWLYIVLNHTHILLKYLPTYTHTFKKYICRLIFLTYFESFQVGNCHGILRKSKFNTQHHWYDLVFLKNGSIKTLPNRVAFPTCILTSFLNDLASWYKLLFGGSPKEC